MLRNMGAGDRLLRAALVAPVLAVVAVIVGATTVVGVVLWAVAAVMLATSALGFCPLYRLVGVDTRRHARTH